MEIGVQTDLLLERLETPIYVPAKSGCDVETQIIPGDVSAFRMIVNCFGFFLFIFGLNFSCSISKSK